MAAWSFDDGSLVLKILLVELKTCGCLVTELV